MEIYGWYWCNSRKNSLLPSPVLSRITTQLIYHQKAEEAAIVIAKVFPDGTAEQVEQKARHISFHIEQTKS